MTYKEACEIGEAITRMDAKHWGAICRALNQTYRGFRWEVDANIDAAHSAVWTLTVLRNRVAP